MKAEQEGIGDYTSISRGWKGQIDGGITSGDIYLVEQEKEKDIITERNKLKKIIDKNEERKKKEQQKAEEKAIKKTNK